MTGPEQLVEDGPAEGPLERESPAGGTVPGTDLLTMADAARIKGVSYHTVSRAVRRGRLPVQRLGRMALIAAPDLEAWRPMTERRPRRYQQTEEGSVLHVFERAADDSIDLARSYAMLIEGILEDALSLDLATFLARCAERIADGFGCLQVAIWALDGASPADRGHLTLAARIRVGSANRAPARDPLGTILELRQDPMLEEFVAGPRPRIVPAVPRPMAAQLGIPERAGGTLVAPMRTFRGQLGLVVAQQGIRALSDAELRVLERLLNQMAFGWETLRDRVERDTRIAALEAAIDAAPVGLRIVGTAGWSLRNEQDRTFFPDDSDAATMVEAEIARTQSDGRPGDLMTRDEDGRQLDVETHPLPPLGAGDDRDGPVGVVVVSRDLSEALAEHDEADRTIRALRGELESARAISTLIRRMQGAASPDEVVRQGASTMIQAIGGDGALFELRDEGGRFARVPLGNGEPEPETLQPFQPMSYPSTVLALARRRPVSVTHALAATFEREIMERMRWQGMLVIPLIARDDQLGFAMVGYADDTAPDSAAIDLARDLAVAMAEAIVAARTMVRLQDDVRRVRTVMEQVPQAVMIIQGVEGALGFANAAARQLWGWEQRQDPHSILDLTVMDPEGNAIERDAHPLMLGVRTGRSFLGEPLTIRTIPGEAVDVLATIAPVLAPDGTIGGSVILLQDRLQFRRLEAAKEAFVAMVAHELRNPITSVMGNMRLLERQIARAPEALDPALRSRITVLSRQVGMMSGLVSRLLDRSRLEFGHLDSAPVAPDAVAIVPQASDDAAVLMEGRTIAVNAPAQLPVRWEEVRMGQVMGNLLANAARYGAGTVEVSMELVAPAPEGDGGRVRIAVRDHGPGVDPVVRARLFNPHR
ncbi:MAG: histidine kinase dimerization/phospho-acceptor domain-containing protein, partial [Thermomicrobiales bacterium]